MLQVAVDALSLGSVYALVALGIGLLYGVLRIINFAQGQFISIAAFALIVPSSRAVAQLAIGALPWPLVVLGVSAVVVVIALIADYLVFRPLRRASGTTVMVASFALGYVLQNLLLLIYGSRPKLINLWSNLNEPLYLGSAEVPRLQLIIIALSLFLLVGLTLLLRYTRIGIEMRAAAENFRMAVLLGVRADRVIALALMTSAVLAAIVALLLVVQTGVLNYQMGLPLLIMGFVATVVGGMGSLVGAVIGGFAVGIVSVLFQTLLPPELRAFRDTFVFALIVLVLLFRPSGIIRARQRGERV